MARMDALVSSFWPRLIAGRGDWTEFFSRTPVVDAPRTGLVTGERAFEEYAAKTHQWLGEREARLSPVATTSTVERIVEESVLEMRGRDGETIGLPVAIVAEADGTGVTVLRVYHSLWPLYGRHEVRAPLLPARSNLALPGIVAAYQNALMAGDLEGILNAFADDGYAREPSGGPYVYRGKEALRDFYGRLFSDGGIGLAHCTVTDDGTRCAIEYNVLRWGKKDLPLQAGVAVYERVPDGLLIAARIYDDVDPPV